MDEYVGIVRTKEGLNHALKQVLEMEENLIKSKNLSKPYFEALNMVQTALNVINSALNRTKSIGCHFRID